MRHRRLCNPIRKTILKKVLKKVAKKTKKVVDKPEPLIYNNSCVTEIMVENGTTT